MFEDTKAFREAEARIDELSNEFPEAKLGFNPDRPWENDPWRFLFTLLEEVLP